MRNECSPDMSILEVAADVILSSPVHLEGYFIGRILVYWVAIIVIHVSCFNPASVESQPIPTLLL